MHWLCSIVRYYVSRNTLPQKCALRDRRPLAIQHSEMLCELRHIAREAWAEPGTPSMKFLSTWKIQYNSILTIHAFIEFPLKDINLKLTVLS